MKKAFTLIELLVVIAIISILASILLPSLSKAKEAAKGIGCIANLKQFGNANAMYMSDHAGYPPYSTTDMGLWDYELMPYLNYPQSTTAASNIKSFSIFHCPSGATNGYAGISAYMWKGYSYNYYLTANPSAGGYNFRKDCNIANPSNTLVMNDGRFHAERNQEEGTTFSYFGNRPNFSDRLNYSEWTSIRHSRKTNVLFFDAHAALKEVAPTSWGFIPFGVDW